MALLAKTEYKASKPEKYEDVRGTSGLCTKTVPTIPGWGLFPIRFGSKVGLQIFQGWEVKSH